MSSARHGHSPWVVRYAEQTGQPWRNGGGTTRELVVDGDRDKPDDQPGGFQWRVSVADVTRGGDFSVFPGVDRVLVLCQGASMEVSVDGRAHRLQPFEALSFAGEAQTSAKLPDGPTQDLNVMTRRGMVTARVDVEEIGGCTEVAVARGVTTVLVVVEGQLELSTGVTDGATLGSFDAVVLTHPAGPVRLTGTARFVRVAFRRVSE